MEDTPMRELTVDLGERSYPIFVGPGILERVGEFLGQNGIKTTSPLLIVTNRHLQEHGHLERLEDLLKQAGYRFVTYVTEPGEKTKSLAVMEDIIGVALEAGLDRSSTILALGGGVVGDLAGYTAASYMRGIRFVQIPTTILSHDSSVGGKVAVNHPKAKNVIGAFHQPEFVLYDTSLLLTLPSRDVRSGLAELVKEGFILDREFVEWCEKHTEQLLALDPAVLTDALYEGCRIKAHVVSQDEREGGLRAVLNLGHTIGHALEAVAGYNELQHGEAVAIGMIGAAKLAQRLGFTEETYHVMKRVLSGFGLSLSVPVHLDTDAIMSAMMHDKKFKEGEMVFIIPTAVGQVEINSHVSEQWVREVVEELKKEA